eukprot:CAMPEP_0172617614 /NCGR_PEP_ID=MMETSP1068-20121228/70360_1 /TAXON_ID=35684 /ORGANISM="Pseudopedinella elastica, Strain CCMP716" /LENGTH=69 /DNA_ID=CAMNT_0013423405 /DNA_START=60 /DNA_END=265 /DNA_ORIENTATION=-
MESFRPPGGAIQRGCASRLVLRSFFDRTTVSSLGRSSASDFKPIVVRTLTRSSFSPLFRPVRRSALPWL